MSEWHLPPDYIVSNWTDELLNLMVDKLAERKERESAAYTKGGDKTVPEEQLFRDAKNLIKVEKAKDGDHSRRCGT